MTSKRQKVILKVNGGLGNQLFQYAAARSFALDLDADLYLENKIGFLLDYRYHRKFELNHLGTTYYESHFSLSYPFYIEQLKKVMNKTPFEFMLPEFPRGWIFENDMKYLDLDEYERSLSTYWMSGYFQDPRYFSRIRDLIFREFLPTQTLNSEMKDFKDISRRRDLVALGIRLYEESSNPTFHAKEGRMKTHDDFQIAIDTVLSNSIDPKLFVFSTGDFNILEKLRVPRDTVFVNPRTVALTSHEKLQMLSFCKHHIFNNSSFYWWGAYLSGKHYAVEEQQIYCSDNFLNSDIALNHWIRF